MRPCKYLEEFEKAKIILPDISRKRILLLITKENITRKHAFNFYEGKSFARNFEFKLITFFYSNLSSQVKGGYFRITYQYIAQIPIAKGTDKQRTTIEERVAKILKLKKSGKSTSELEKEIDAIVYEMYGLTEEEVGVVEDSTRRVEGK